MNFCVKLFAEFSRHWMIFARKIWPWHLHVVIFLAHQITQINLDINVRLSHLWKIRKIFIYNFKSLRNSCEICYSTQSLNHFTSFKSLFFTSQSKISAFSINFSLTGFLQFLFSLPRDSSFFAAPLKVKIFTVYNPFPFSCSFSCNSQLLIY